MLVKRILITWLLFIAGGCAPTRFNGQPIEQMTVRFNAGLMDHTGEYRLIRPLAQQNQCLWQLYTDGDLSATGQMQLPADGLSAVFAEAGRVAGARSATTKAATQRGDLPDAGNYLIHFTYETPYDKQDTEYTGSLSRVSRMMEQAGQVYGIHKIIVRKLPPTFWFAYLQQSRVAD